MKILCQIMSMLLIVVASFTSAGAAEREEKVVYHISDSANASAALVNIRNHLDASPKAKIVVVTHGPGIDFLVEGATNKNGNPYDIPVQELADRKVEFRVCNNTLEARKIDKGRLLPEATLVPSGVAEISRLQVQKGYAYLKP
jgi:intracellular sulfur oxidation DsrE/DsrF family protein